MTTLDALLLSAPTADPRKFASKDFPYIDIEALDNQNQEIADVRLVATARAPSRARRLVANGDILFSLVRPYLKNIAIVPSRLGGAIASTAFFVCRPADGVDSRYLYNLLRQDALISSLPTYGNSPPAARDEEFADLRIPVAPAAEQIRIADALDELFSDLDAAVAALRRAQARLADYRASVLNATVRGDLTADWRRQHPEVEPASVLLKRMLAERRRQPEPQPSSGQTENHKFLPASWTLTCLADLGKWSGGGTPAKANKEFWSNGTIPWVSPKDMKQAEIFDSEDHITAAALNASPASLLPHGALLIVTRSGILRHSLPVAVARVPVAVNQDIKALTPHAGINPSYVAYALQARAQEILQHCTKDGTTVQSIDFDKLKRFPLSIPPTAEQEVIAASLDGRLASQNRLAAEISGKLTAAAGLRQAILRQAFAGKLVPQDPNDEPASELLKRIAAERARQSVKMKAPRARAATASHG